MTLTASLIAHQSKAGQPLNLSGRVTSGFGDPAADNVWLGVGVTTTSTPPATFAAFAYSEGGANYGDAYWNRGTDRYFNQFVAGSETAETSTVTIGRKIIPLDTNFQAGRYLWLAASSANPPIGSTVPAALSSPYLIH